MWKCALYYGGKRAAEFKHFAGCTGSGERREHAEAAQRVKSSKLPDAAPSGKVVVYPDRPSSIAPPEFGLDCTRQQCKAGNATDVRGESNV